MEVSDREWNSVLAEIRELREEVTELRLMMARILSWVNIGPWLFVLVGGLAALGAFLSKSA